MTHRQLTWLGVLSTIATALVLFGAAGEADLSAAARAAIAGGASAPPSAGADDGGAGATQVAAARADSGDDAAEDEAASSPAVSASAPTEAAAQTDPAEEDSEADEDAGEDAPTTPVATTPASTGPPKTNVEHVFVITLDGQGLDAAFGAGSRAPYLSGELRPKGTLLSGFTSLGGAGLPDRIAFAGGQPPNAATRAECATYAEIPPATEPTKAGVIDADGCVYPNSVVSLGDQLTANRLTWQAYAEDHEKGPGGPATLCRRPVSGQPDGSQVSRPGDAYAARNNPWIYFHSLLDLSGCDSDVGPLAPLEAALADPKLTPNLAYIAPNLCHDGSESPCADGGVGGLAAADAFLRTWVPKILASKAYAERGVLVITFAGGPGEAPSKNGTLVLSRFAQPGGTDTTETNPYGLLRTVEDLLGIKPLGLAADAPSFAGTVLGSAKIVVAGDD